MSTEDHIREEEIQESIESITKVPKNNSYEILESPFREAFIFGASIDYKLNPDSKTSDHAYVKKFGYESEMMPDCSYHAKGLKGFSLSSYGDWGTYFVDWGDENTHKMFLDMVEKKIIIPWRVRKYLRLENETITYDYDERGWRCYNGEKWVPAENPFDLIIKELASHIKFLDLFGFKPSDNMPEGILKYLDYDKD